MRIEEIYKLREQGWTLAEITRGKGWQAKYPHLAAFPGSVATGTSSDGGSGYIWSITATIRSGFEIRFHSIEYTLIKEKVPALENSSIHAVADEMVRKWMEENGANAIAFYKNGWNREGDWDERYPHIQVWARQGRRHCIEVEINCVTRENHVMAWHYDNPAKKETVIFEAKMKDVSEAEVLRVLDEGIARWRAGHKHLWGRLPLE